MDESMDSRVEVWDGDRLLESVPFSCQDVLTAASLKKELAEINEGFVGKLSFKDAEGMIAGSRQLKPAAYMLRLKVKAASAAEKEGTQFNLLSIASS
jgi:hypothetical protein